MEHPFFRNLKFLVYYAALWILVSGIHFAVLWIYYQLDFQASLLDSLSFNIIFSLLGIPIWYTIIYNNPKKNKYLNVFINHLTTATVVLIIWIYSGTAICNLPLAENYLYLSFLDKSIVWRTISGIFLYLTMVLIYYLIIYYNSVQERLNNEAKLREIIKESELNLLKSQINPHFLFNSLNSISSLTTTDAVKAQEMIIKLSDFLRYSISNPGNMFSTLGSELENIKRYLEIEKIRFGDKLFFDFQIEESCFNLEIPVMILQPLFENAVKHGVYESIGQVFVKTSCENSGNKLVAIIENNFESNIKSKQGAGIGLNNIRERLRLIYRNDQLVQTAVNGDIFQVKLIIPQILKENEDVERKIKSTDY